MKIHLQPLCLLALFGFGCSSAADEQAKATRAENEATKEIAELARKAQDKAAEVRAEVRAEADKEVAEAQADFLKLREDFRHETSEHVVELDKKIADLEAELTTLKGNAKSELEARLVAIRAARREFARDFQAIADESAMTWDAAKRRLEKRWGELERSVERAD